MRRWLAAFVVSVLTLPTLANASGVNIRWSKCYSDGGSAHRTFTCGTNTGSEALVLAFALDHAKTGVSGIEIYLSVASTGSTLPAWWAFKNAGSCRQSSLTANSNPPAGSVNCADWGGGTQAGGLAAYAMGVVAPNQTRVILGWAVPSNALANLVLNQEYFVCNLVFNHSNTVGSGACAGCTTPVVVFLEGMLLATPIGGASNETLTLPSNEPESQWVTWQNGFISNLQRTTCAPQSLNCQLGLLTTFGASTGITARWPRAGAR